MVQLQFVHNSVAAYSLVSFGLPACLRLQLPLQQACMLKHGLHLPWLALQDRNDNDGALVAMQWLM